MIETGNLFERMAMPRQGEAFSELFRSGHAHVERIVSHKHASPAGFWYDQDSDEWVVVVRGSAVLGFADGQRLALREGDWVTIPAGCRHRVDSTADETVWLAVHVQPESRRAPAPEPTTPPPESTP